LKNSKLYYLFLSQLDYDNLNFDLYKKLNKYNSKLRLSGKLYDDVYNECDKIYNCIRKSKHKWLLSCVLYMRSNRSYLDIIIPTIDYNALYPSLMLPNRVNYNALYKSLRLFYNIPIDAFYNRGNNPLHKQKEMKRMKKLIHKKRKQIYHKNNDHIRYQNERL
jgi:hypothetical protein